jgi:hypothetical protein
LTSLVSALESADARVCFKGVGLVCAFTGGTAGGFGLGGASTSFFILVRPAAISGNLLRSVSAQAKRRSNPGVRFRSLHFPSGRDSR